MNHYIDIRLRPDPEFSAAHLMAALFSKLHRVLAQRGELQVGVSFPLMEQQHAGLGGVMRLFGDAKPLDMLMAEPWLLGMRDHTEVGAITLVPDYAQYRQLKRVQAKSSPERLRRRSIKCLGISEQEAKTRIPDSAAKWLNLPYLQLQSGSTGQRFRLFLELGPLQQAPQPGLFNRYGLSPSATIPWF